MTSTDSDTPRRRSLLREPLVAFVAFGVLAVGLDLATGGLDDAPDTDLVPATEPAIDTTIVVDDALIEDIARELEVRLERAPSDDEITVAVDAWVAEEVFVREALSRDLHVGDALVRAHLARKMAEVYESREVAPEPTDDELRDYYEANLAEWTLTTQITLRQLHAGGSTARADAEALLADLQAGADPVELGRDRPTPPGGPVLRGRTPRRLASVYGSAFAEGLDTVPVDTWMLRESTMGWHVVRIEGRRDGGPIPFDQARDRVAVQWQRDAVEAATTEAMNDLRAQYTVEGWPR